MTDGGKLVASIGPAVLLAGDGRQREANDAAMADELGAICGRAVALGWKKDDAGRVEAAAVVVAAADLSPAERAALEDYCRGVVARAKGEGA